MKFDSDKHHRRSIRLRGYDYSHPGAYFVTFCAFNKECLFGRIVDGQMRVNDFGRIVHEEWFRSWRIRREIELDAFVVMPNHVHGIVRLVGAHGMRPGVAQDAVRREGRHPVPASGRRLAPASRIATARGTRRVPLRRPRSLASFVAGLKSVTTGRIVEIRGTPNPPVWQRNYYEHIVRNDEELNKIREYITTNPLRWAWDRENPEAKTSPDDTPPWDW